MSRLDLYRKKRHFGRTREPEGGGDAGGEEGGGSGFVIQKHAASRLHYDLRLEMGGVLRSWAVPKGPSYDPAEKRLAVHVEDHPLEYAGFEGMIPNGEYGGGTVMLWDRGTFEAVGDAERGYQKGDLKFELHGERLRGGWVLVRMGGKAGGGGKNWLLIKEKDGHVMAAAEAGVWLEAQDTSVTSGRTMSEIAEGKDAVWSGDAPELAEIDGATPAKLEEVYPLQLATLAKATPGGDRWVHEIKLDGYRLLARKDGNEVRLFTRNGHDWTDRFVDLAAAIRQLPAETAAVDGEAVVLDANGISRFQLLQKSLKRAGRTPPSHFFVFDLLHLDGFDLRGAKLTDRKAVLRSLIDRVGGGGASGAGGMLRYSDHITGSGRLFHEQACGHELEGIISKRGDARYSAGRTTSWVKSKCLRRQEYIVVGYTDPSGSRTGFGALLLGTHTDGELVYCGRVGTGFDEATLKELHGMLQRMQRKTPPLDAEPPARERKVAHWVTPKLVAEIEFAEWTADRMLRHARFIGLREDKSAEDVVLEVPRDVEAIETSDEPSPPGAGDDAGEALAAMRLTHPDRVLYPDAGITKRDLAGFYADIAEWVLPHVAGRPLSLLRCPKGIGAKGGTGGREASCFFQKHLGYSAPDALRQIDIADDDGEGSSRYAVVDDVAGLLSLVQIGVLEVHPWGSRADDPERPDRLFFDLDPGPGTTWADVVDAARLFREALDHLGLQSFCKLTGGKGVHVVVPLDRTLTWPELKAFARALSQQVAGADPQAYTVNMSKAKRQGRIFLDYLRNGRGATAGAAYSTRARAGAPVSTPIRWDELTPSLTPDRYTVANLRRRLASLKADPWDSFFDVRQAVTAPMQQAVGINR